MKSLNFLQMWFLSVSERHIYDAWLCNALSKDHVNLCDWARFLNQKFEPEMIEKYLEGFAQTTYSSFTGCPNNIIYGKYEFSFAPEFYFRRLVKKEEEGDCLWSQESFRFPSTLDRFISDCQEAGIELKLKEQSDDAI